MKTSSGGERPNIKLNTKDLTLDLEQVPAMVRYIFGLRFFKTGCSVLDIGCGYGHGVLFQSLYAKKVVGVDVSDEALEIANQIKSTKNLLNVSYVKGIENVKGTYDVITAFEIIEHIEKKEGIKLIKNAKKLVNKDGIFIISTPYIDLRGKTYWYHHKHEYYTLELSGLLKKYFKYVDCYYHLGDGFYIKKGLMQSIFAGGYLSSASSLIFVCSNKKENLNKNFKERNSFYLFLRGLYRNTKYLIFKK